MCSKTVQVSELVSLLKKGITPKYSDDSNESTIPVINQKCIRDFSVNFELCRLHDRSKRKVADDKLLKKFDVLINSTGTGTLGRVAQYFGANDEVTVDSHVAILRPNDDIDPIYFGYLIKSKQKIIETLFTGSTGQTELDKNAVNELECEIIADKSQQERIGKILKALDDKIENNQPMNQTLEKLAQRIFKSWFIDFDPVKANKEGLPFDGLSPEIQALFPSEFEDSELGMIPKGWEVSTIKQLQEKLSKGTTPRKKDVESAQDAPSIPFIKVRNISDTGSIESELETVASSIHEGALKRSILQSEDLLFTIAGTIGRVAIVPDRLNDSNCNQAVCFIRLKDKPTYNNYLYLHLKSKRIQEQISSKVVQAVQANASLQNINDINFPLPTSKLMESWNKVTLPLFDRIKEIEKQNITLTRLRDRLLPKLVSGQISVGEAAQELAEAV